MIISGGVNIPSIVDVAVIGVPYRMASELRWRAADSAEGHRGLREVIEQQLSAAAASDRRHL